MLYRFRLRTPTSYKAMPPPVEVGVHVDFLHNYIICFYFIMLVDKARGVENFDIFYM